MAKVLAITGNAACALAMSQINPDVVPAYPITPQTTVVEEFSKYVADGVVDTEYVTVESEHSAMSCCIGASAAGSRVITATSSQGLALMWEMLYIASGLRLPIVLHNINRTLSAPINIHCDHSDSMGARDSGWIQIFSENAQEAYDNTIQAIRIAEDMRVRLPVMIMYDGFIISHAIDRIETLEDDEVKSFIGEYKSVYSLLDVKNPVTMGAFDGLHGYFFEFRRMAAEVMNRSKGVIDKVGKEYGKLSGREYGFFEKYKLDDAEVAIVILGSAAGTCKNVVDQLRERGIKVGMLKLRVFRPFPTRELIEAVKHLKALAVLDRSDSVGAFGGPLFIELRNCLFDLPQKPLINNYIYGLGGRDIDQYDFMKVYSDLEDISETGSLEKIVNYLGVKE